MSGLLRWLAVRLLAAGVRAMVARHTQQLPPGGAALRMLVLALL